MILCLGVAILVGGAAIVLLTFRLRDELNGVTDVARLRGDLGALAAVEGRLENGDAEALADAGALMADLRRDVARAADHFPEMADGTSFVSALADAYDRVFALRSRGVAPSAEIEDQLDELARGTDVYLLDTGDRTEARADERFREGIGTLMVGTSLVLLMAVVTVWRLRRSADVVRRAALREESDRRIRALIEHAPDVVVLLDRTSRAISFASPSLSRVLGYEPGEMAGRRVGELIHPDDRASAVGAFERALLGSSSVGATCRITHADGTWRHFELSISSPTDTADFDGIVVNARDITDRVELQRSLTHQASHDPLTGLANRSAFVELLHSAADDRRSRLALVFFDLDGFKEINDSLGHAAGDEVLMTIAARLVTLTRLRDHVARLGGDEFAIAVEGDDPMPLAERLIDVIGQPIDLATGPVQVGASIGVAELTEEVGVEDLLRRADVAMYDAKATGKNRVSVFEPYMQEAVVGRVAMRHALDAALADNEFRLVYQPEIDLRDGRLLGYEALLRWHRSDGTVVPPLDFIPIAETSGQIVGIGRWVLRTALGQLARWQAEFEAPHLTMAVNVSARQLEDEGFVQAVAEELFRVGVPACSLTLELTETTLINDIALATQRLGELHDIGVMIAIDDYGSGHASIGYLREFPVDIVKIDRSFVAALDDRPQEAEAYLRSITELARALSIDTVAEGIEHSVQLERLRSLECRIGQGYHLARPLDVAAAEAFLAERTGRVR